MLCEQTSYIDALKVLGILHTYKIDALSLPSTPKTQTCHQVLVVSNHNIQNFWAITNYKCGTFLYIDYRVLRSLS